MIPQISPEAASLEVEKGMRKQNFLTFLQSLEKTQAFFHPFKYPKHAKQAVHILKADKCCN